MNKSNGRSGQITWCVAWVPFCIMLLLWVIGLVMDQTLGGALHLLLAGAIVIGVTQFLPKSGSSRRWRDLIG